MLDSPLRCKQDLRARAAFTLGSVRARRTLKAKAMARDFGSRLKQTREARRITQQELARLAEVDVMQISRYERGLGMPAAETIVALSDVLAVSTDFLLLGKDAEKEPRELPVGDVLLLERFREAQRLQGADREALLIVIDSILVRRDEEERVEKRRRVS